MRPTPPYNAAGHTCWGRLSSCDFFHFVQRVCPATSEATVSAQLLRTGRMCGREAISATKLRTSANDFPTTSQPLRHLPKLICGYVTNSFQKTDSQNHRIGYKNRDGAPD